MRTQTKDEGDRWNGVDLYEAPDSHITNRLFVYGIFLGQDMRERYGMANPKYATVPNYATFGEHIVQAVYIEGAGDLALTGLTVDVDPTCWDRLDALEAGYDRALVTTDNDEQVYMYVAKGN